MFSAKRLTIGCVVAVVLTAIFVTALVSGVRVSTRTISSRGVVSSANLGVYSDSACATALTSIGWGTVSPGGSATQTVYVKNIGNREITLSMAKSNWSPATADGPLAITWNQEGAMLIAGQVSAATLTLSVASSVSDIAAFSVDVVISGTG